MELISKRELVDKLLRAERIDAMSVGTAIKRCKVYESKPQGKWVEDEEQRHVEITYHCNNCGYSAWGEQEKTNYCGNCGADMRGKE